MTPNLKWEPGMTLEKIEKDAILQSLRWHRGNKAATANSLGMSVRNLDNKLTQFQKEDEAEIKRRNHDDERQADFLLRQQGRHPDQLQRIAAAEKERQKKYGKKVLQDDAGNGVEPASGVSEEQPLPLPIGPEIQGVSSKSTSSGSSNKGSRNVRGGNEASQSNIHNERKSGKGSP